MHRQFSESVPELMDLPNPNEEELRVDLQNLARINRAFGGTQAMENAYKKLAEGSSSLWLFDVCSGYGDHARHLQSVAEAQDQNLKIVAVDFQFPTLKLAREATLPEQKIYYVQADARQLPFRTGAGDLVCCSLALHHFSQADARQILQEMNRVGRGRLACLDLVRGRLAAWCIWALTAFIMREPMTRHDARLSIRRAFSFAEMKTLADAAGWKDYLHIRLPWFRQALLKTTLSASQ